MKTQLIPKCVSTVLIIFFAFLFMVGYCSLAAAAPPLPGAIFTTDIGCAGTNVNIYTSKGAVYLDGGPAHTGAAGLLEGDYYVQVTEPMGTVLGTSVGSSNETPVHVNASGEFASCYQLAAILRKASDSGPFPVSPDGYDTTSNPGGEYKVWVSTVGTFDNNATKTDNFKVKENDECQPSDETCNQPPPPAEISGVKFYDADIDGVQDPSEDVIQNWHITLYLGDSCGGTKVDETMTDGDGAYKFLVDFVVGAKYTVCEEVPDGWKATTSDHHTVTLVLNGTTPVLTYANNDFGNIQIFDIGGTKYKDSNMSGTADPGEVVLPGVTIHIHIKRPDGSEDDLVRTTDMSGNWAVTGLYDGTVFTACEDIPTGYTNTAPVCLGPQTITADVTGLNFFNIPVFPISGIKYYDSDLSGSLTAGDMGLAGIKITIKVTYPNAANTMVMQMLFTGAGGAWTSNSFPEGSSFVVMETLPGSNWTQVTNSGTIGTVNSTTPSVKFLNVCSLTPGGHTLGYWSNKNGLGEIIATDVTGMPGLNFFNLRNQTGTDNNFTFPGDFKDKGVFNKYLLGANATSMAYMLSAQMSATFLSVKHNYTNGGVFVGFDSQGNPLDVNGMITYANSLLANPIAGGTFIGQNGSVTVASTALRAEQGRVKDILDKINNNGSFLQIAPCTVSYPSN